MSENIDVFSLKKTKRQIKMRRICEREGILDDYGYHPHHCFFRSEYMQDDYDDDWNIEPVYATMHTGGNKAVHGGNRQFDKKLKNKALKRYKGKHKDELIKIMRKSGYEIG